MTTGDALEAIQALCFRYTFALDDGDFAEVGRLLGRGVLRPAMPGVAAEPYRGAAEIEGFYRDQVITYRGSPRTRHLITNQLIEVEEPAGTARSRCYFTVLQRAPGHDYEIVVGGQYFDVFALSGEGWHFTEKTIQVDHLNRIERHFKISDEARTDGASPDRSTGER